MFMSKSSMSWSRRFTGAQQCIQANPMFASGRGPAAAVPGSPDGALPPPWSGADCCVSAADDDDDDDDVRVVPEGGYGGWLCG